MDTHSTTLINNTNGTGNNNNSTNPESQTRTTTTILGSFLRGRPRNTSQSHIQVELGRDMLRRRRSAGNVASSGSAAPPPPPASHRYTAAPAIMAAAATTTTTTAMTTAPQQQQQQGSDPSTPASGTAAIPATTTTTSHRIRLVPHLDTRRSLRFDAISRDLHESSTPLRIGRFTDRSGLGLSTVNNTLTNNKLAFRSKVVSRAHAEIWVEGGGKFFVKDTKSSSGTFLNHVRLSPANTESKPWQIKDGDILQLGVDYQGGAEDIYKSVKIRIEIGREWQSGANAFNTNALKNLKSLALPGKQSTSPSAAAPGAGALKLPVSGRSQLPDCCICLFSVTIRQALFIAPCSHTFHFKCIRPLIEAHHPAFSCPLCRTYADLEDDVEVEVEWEDEEGGASGVEGLAITSGAAGGDGAISGGEDAVSLDHHEDPPIAVDDEERRAHIHHHHHVHGGYHHPSEVEQGTQLRLLSLHIAQPNQQPMSPEAGTPTNDFMDTDAVPVPVAITIPVPIPATTTPAGAGAGPSSSSSGGGGFLSRFRTGGTGRRGGSRATSPLADESSDAHGGGEYDMVVDGDGMLVVNGGVDVDGTVGGKRKR